jgi:hypothetical protein
VQRQKIVAMPVAEIAKMIDTAPHSFQVLVLRSIDVDDCAFAFAARKKSLMHNHHNRQAKSTEDARASVRAARQAAAQATASQNTQKQQEQHRAKRRDAPALLLTMGVGGGNTPHVARAANDRAVNRKPRIFQMAVTVHKESDDDPDAGMTFAAHEGYSDRYPVVRAEASNANCNYVLLLMLSSIDPLPCP